MERRLQILGALLILGVGVVHLEQYLDFIKDVPTIGVLFLLNAFAAGAIVLLLASPFALLPAVSGIALSVGSLISIAIARYAASGLFSYREPTWRTPIVIAVALEVAAVAVLSGLEVRRRRATR
jgi:ribose/xylose/arabinose/galactoside ABC-type transport system permease subunit